MDNTLVFSVILVCLFLFGICAIEHYFRNAVIPAICWVLLAGIAYSAVAINASLNIPRLQLEADIVLFILLPLLIFDSSRKLEWTELKSVGIEAGIFATLRVGFEMLSA